MALELLEGALPDGNLELFDLMRLMQTGGGSATGPEWRRRVTPAHVWEYARQLLVAMRYIHNAKVVHGDLRGENIFLQKVGVGPGTSVGPTDGTVHHEQQEMPEVILKVGDFGLARLVDKTGGPWQLPFDVNGQPIPSMWMAPEEMAGETITPSDSQFEHRCFALDLYRVGLLIASLATAGHMFGREFMRTQKIMVEGKDGEKATVQCETPSEFGHWPGFPRMSAMLLVGKIMAPETSVKKDANGQPTGRINWLGGFNPRISLKENVAGTPDDPRFNEEGKKMFGDGVGGYSENIIEAWSTLVDEQVLL